MYILYDHYSDDKWGDTLQLFYHEYENAKARARRLLQKIVESEGPDYLDADYNEFEETVEELIERVLEEGELDDVFSIEEIKFED